jgi:hypothetical protein
VIPAPSVEPDGFRPTLSTAPVLASINDDRNVCCAVDVGFRLPSPEDVDARMPPTASRRGESRFEFGEYEPGSMLSGPKTSERLAWLAATSRRPDPKTRTPFTSRQPGPQRLPEGRTKPHPKEGPVWTGFPSRAQKWTRKGNGHIQQWTRGAEPPTPEGETTRGKDSRVFPPVTEVADRTRPTTPAQRTHTHKGYRPAGACAERSPQCRPPEGE